MKIYKTQETNFGKIFILNDMENNVYLSFGETPGNRHYEEYLLWLAEGNTPEVIND